MDNRGVLGIHNRTENWKTASTFIPLIASDKQQALAIFIVKNATGKTYSWSHDEVKLELFWKGFRDYCKTKIITSKCEDFVFATALSYKKMFPLLRVKILEYNVQAKPGERLNPLENHNYLYNTNKIFADKLYRNLLNTEIDVVLSTPEYLLIGEAKDEQAFGTDSNHILVHQLVRQYVMASILVKILREDQPQRGKITVIPFIIGNNLDKYAQVKLHEYLGFLIPENVITWDQLK